MLIWRCRLPSTCRLPDHALPTPCDSSRSCSACPGIGPKGAQRLAFHILKTPREQTDRLADALRDVKERVTYCSVCNNITDADPCTYCSNGERNHNVICVVEEPQNVAPSRRRASSTACTTC